MEERVEEVIDRDDVISWSIQILRTVRAMSILEVW